MVDRPTARVPIRTGENVLRDNPSPDPAPDPGPALIALAIFSLGEDTLILSTSRAMECGLIDVLVTAVALFTVLPPDWLLLP